MSVFSPVPLVPTVLDRGGVLVTYDSRVLGSDERSRRAMIAENRMYYQGTQFDEDNRVWRETNAIPDNVHIPEHERLHNYATQIAECVDLIANALTDGFQIHCRSTAAQRVIDEAVDATDLLHNASDEDIAVDSLMIDAAQAGDVPYETRWDPINGRVYWEFWTSEQVEFDVPRGSYVRKVTREQPIVVEALENGVSVPKAVVEKVVYEMVDVDDHRECRKRTFHDESDEPVDEEFLGVPFIPWGLIRVYKEGITGFRGDPLITRKAIDNADRYNANEQKAFLIAQFNSHGNLAVVGDASFLQLQRNPDVPKDVADVLSFPGGTAVYPITLPTDPQMIEHTRQVCGDAIYASFGLTRVEPDTLKGIGGISGYALEILNRKSEAKLRRVRRTFKTDVITMCNQALDVFAYRQAATLDDDLAEDFRRNPELEVPDEAVPEIDFWTIDPLQVFAGRDIEIRMGTGYIVDDVAIRDDFTGGLYSLAEALRQRGHSDAEISQIIAEKLQDIERGFEANLSPPKPTVVTQADQTVPQAQDERPGAEVTPSGTQAGKTTGSTQRK